MSMTPDEINAAIAEWCKIRKTTECEDCYGTGYGGSECDHIPCGACSATGRVKEHFVNPPNYYSDLNAMHEAEKELSEAEKTVYAETLCAIVRQEIVDWGYYPGETQIDWHSVAALIFATSAQRCEALLRTIGKWKEQQ